MKKLLVFGALLGMSCSISGFAVAHSTSKKGAPMECCQPSAASATSVNTSAKSAANATKVVLAVDNMHCAGCAQGVESALKKVTGVQSAKADFKAKTATVLFVSAKVAPKTIAAHLSKAGWPAKVAVGKVALSSKPAMCADCAKATKK